MKLLFVLLAAPAMAAPLPNTTELDWTGDLAAKMVDDIHSWLDRAILENVNTRAALWKLDASSAEAWEKSLEPKRARLRQLLGMVDGRAKPEMRPTGPAIGPDDLIPTEQDFRGTAGSLEGTGPISRVEWTVFRSLRGEGLLTGGDRVDFIVIPDCGRTPEQSFGLAPGLEAECQWANRLAALGHRVLAMAVPDRRTGAKMPDGRESKFSQREVLWRAGFEMGRTLAGYEVQKVLAAVDWLCAGDPERRVGIIGSGDGGFIALLAAALDSRIESVGIEGAFAPLEMQWQQPIDRTVFSLTKEFGAAELAAMAAPRHITLRSAAWPEVSLTDAGGGAPGSLSAVDQKRVQQEVERSLAIPAFRGKSPQTISTAGKADEFLHRTLAPFVWYETNVPFAVPQSAKPGPPVDESVRQARLFNNLLDDTQQLMRQAQKTRAEYWKKADFSSAEKFSESAKAYRTAFAEEITGRLPAAEVPANPRSRQIYDTPKFRGYEVVLDVAQDVFACGILLLPKELKDGEKRPVIVCQHGLEGRPTDVANPDFENPSYHKYAVRLAELGCVVFAPQNPYIGRTHYRQICRKAWPLGLSLWSFIVRQHEVITDWLAGLPNADPQRIAFYGLSYGGKSAMRLPALIGRYCLSICSADYNEWIWKNVDASAPYSYLHTMEYDMVEWNLGNTFNYAELSWLIFPRPFMVERGHDDGVSCDEWVAYEFARTFRHYSKLGLADRAEIEFFNGPHTIHGVGTFAFLKKHLGWPAP